MHLPYKIFMKKILALLFLATLSLSACGERDTKYDAFVSCLVDADAQFYGAFWCPHCQDQKKMFGDSVDLLPYIECDPKGKDAQPQVCLDQKIEGFPTWIFRDGTRLTGPQSLDVLGERTNCPVPVVKN